MNTSNDDLRVPIAIDGTIDGQPMAVTLMPLDVAKIVLVVVNLLAMDQDAGLLFRNLQTNLDKDGMDRVWRAAARRRKDVLRGENARVL